MKHNVFEKEETQDTTLSHAVQGEILGLAKQSNVGSFQTALAIYAQEAAANGDETLQHGIDNIESARLPSAVSVPARWMPATSAPAVRATRRAR